MKNNLDINLNDLRNVVFEKTGFKLTDEKLEEAIKEEGIYFFDNIKEFLQDGELICWDYDTTQEYIDMLNTEIKPEYCGLTIGEMVIMEKYPDFKIARIGNKFICINEDFYIFD